MSFDIFCVIFCMILVVMIMSPPYSVLLLVTFDKSLAIDIGGSLAARMSRLASHIDLHSLRSGYWGDHCGLLLISTQCHLAKPCVPSGHVCVLVSLTLVRFHWTPRTFFAAQWFGKSSSFASGITLGTDDISVFGKVLSSTTFYNTK